MRPSVDWVIVVIVGIVIMGIVAVAMLGLLAVGVGVLDLPWPAALGVAVASILLNGLVAAVVDE